MGEPLRAAVTIFIHRQRERLSRFARFGAFEDVALIATDDDRQRYLEALLQKVGAHSAAHQFIVVCMLGASEPKYLASLIIAW